MSKREEIREGMAKADYEALGHDLSTWDEITDAERDVYFYRVDTYHLPYLHSQGVVIKVDEQVLFAGYEVIVRMKCVFVEPLIEAPNE